MVSPSLKHFLGEGPALIGAYLEEQQNLTAVERFSSAHDRMHDARSPRPKLEKHYRDLLPLEKPKPGQQYAFEVDLDRCSGCKACVTACHNLNGLDADETWRSVGLIHNVIGKPLQQTVTTACQHCLEPACSHGCPVKAYEKDPVTGIVKHLDDQCIGCEYCILKCPYDVPQYHEELGIVRKCDMCVGRLEAGEAPACVQACPTKAIRITLVDQAEVRANSAVHAALPGAPDPSYTLPTTKYKTARVFPEGMEAADAYKLRKEKAHMPLVCMLALSQMGAGLMVATEIGSLAGWLPMGPGYQAAARLVGALIMLGAITVSIAHLGRPLYAFRAFLGFRRSWLSREIIAFGLLGGLASAAAAGSLFAAIGNVSVTGHAHATLPGMAAWPLRAAHAIPGAWPVLSALQTAFATPALRIALAIAALLAVHCSAMVYRDTPRALWATRLTSAKFFLSGALTGLSGLLALTSFYAFHKAGRGPDARSAAALHTLLTALCSAVPALLIAKLACEAQVQKHLDDQEATPLKKAALLLRGQLRAFHNLRFNAALLGGFLLPMFQLYRGFSGGLGDAWMAMGIMALSLAGEFLERYLFFTACVPPRMPGA